MNTDIQGKLETLLSGGDRYTQTKIYQEVVDAFCEMAEDSAVEMLRKSLLSAYERAVTTNDPSKLRYAAEGFTHLGKDASDSLRLSAFKERKLVKRDDGYYSVLPDADEPDEANDCKFDANADVLRFRFASAARLASALEAPSEVTYREIFNLNRYALWQPLAAAGVAYGRNVIEGLGLLSSFVGYEAWKIHRERQNVQSIQRQEQAIIEDYGFSKV